MAKCTTILEHILNVYLLPQVTRLTLYDNQIGRIDAAAFDGLTR